MPDYEDNTQDMLPELEAPVAPNDSASESDKALAAAWLEKIKRAQRVHAPAFKRMEECMYMAVHGANKQWAESGRYVVPVVSRHINLAVAQLYAKNPSTVIERRKRRMYTVWDGTAEMLEAAQGAATPLAEGAMPDPAAVMQLQALMADIESVKRYNTMVDGTAETLSILWDYMLDEQTLGFKIQLKKLVRRAKVCGVGYVKLGFQREYEPVPDRDAKLEDQTEQLAAARRLERKISEGDVADDSPDIASYQAIQESLSTQGELIREGLYLSYPKATRIVIDPGCCDLKTLLGAGWIAEEMYMTAEQIQETYGVDLPKETIAAAEAMDYKSDQGKESSAVRVYEVQCKRTKTYFTLCEGYEGFLSAPAAPPVFLERFFNVLPLVFNEIESDEDLFPPSDVWRARHMQDEYNRSREGLREHRIAARPYYLAGVPMEEKDLERVSGHAAHEIIRLTGIPDGARVRDVLDVGPTANIDPNLYEVSNVNEDILRTVGAQEANLGGLSGGTATESSIAEASRASGIADNVDDLDDLLEAIARAGSGILLMEMSKEAVVEIVGPGAVWPESPATRKEIASEIMLSFEAGSSGRPNEAQDIANLERAAPTLMQLPEWDTKPMARKYARLLGIDPEEAYTAGLPSVVARNGAATGSGAGGVGTAPSAQGPAGGQPSAPAETVGPQPAYPSGEQGLAN